MARVTEYTLERYALGELTEAEAAAVEAALTEDPTLQTRLDDLRAHDAAFLEAHPPAAFVGELVRTHRAEQRRRLAVMGGAGLALAAAALLTIGALSPSATTDPVNPRTGTGEVVRIKGDALKVFLETGARPERLHDADPVMPGATVQLALSPELPYGAVLSVDGRGAVTRHLPARGGKAVALEAGSLPTSFTLDEVADFERFFLVASAEPFALQPVVDALGALGGDPAAEPALPASLAVESLLLRKVYP